MEMFAIGFAQVFNISSLCWIMAGVLLGIIFGCIPGLTGSIALALCLPLAYCLLDAAGTFADSLVLRTLDEDSANCAYELTFLAAAVICFIYVVVIKKDKLVFKAEAPKYAGALFETAGQFAYIYALADEAHVALSAPIISAYCAASVLCSRIFLKEKLSWKHYAMIALVVIGIVMIGIFDI